MPINPVGPGPTLLLLAQEVSKRNGELITSVPTSPGTQTTLTDTRINQKLPVNIPQFYAHVYGTATGSGQVDSLNRGVEVDASGWTASTSMMTLPAPGFPGNITTGTYEIRRLNSRERTVEAINDGIGELDFACLREVKDESLVGVNSQWRYTLPSSQNWATVDRVEIQTNLQFADFPYTPAERMGLTWRAEKTVDSNGNEVWRLQFSSQPPVGYIIRVWGMAFYPDLVNETDVLPLSGRWQRKVLTWLYNWAQAKLFEWNWDAFSQGDGQKAHERAVEHLQQAKQEILEHMKSDQPGRIITPYNQMLGPAWNDPSYLGAFSSGGISSSPFSPVP